MIVSQVIPYERAHGLALLREAQDLARRKGIAELTPQMLEGFAAAKGLVEALRRAAPTPTRASARKALDGLHAFDTGGLAISYSESQHAGLAFSDLAIINGSGRFER